MKSIDWQLVSTLAPVVVIGVLGIALLILSKMKKADNTPVIDWLIIKEHFKESTWFSAAWDWFLKLQGTVTEAFLMFSIIYSSAELVAGFKNVAMDTFVTVAMSIALDAAGLHLLDQADKWKNANKPYKVARSMGMLCFGLMVFNLTLAYFEQKYPVITIVTDVLVGIEVPLRATLAVFYAVLMRKGRRGNGNNSLDHRLVRGSNVIDQMQKVNESMVSLVAELGNRVNALGERIDAQGQALTRQVNAVSNDRVNEAWVNDLLQMVGHLQQKVTIIEESFTPMVNEIQNSVVNACEERLLPQFSTADQIGDSTQLHSMLRPINDRVDTLSSQIDEILRIVDNVNNGVSQVNYNVQEVHTSVMKSIQVTAQPPRPRAVPVTPPIKRVIEVENKPQVKNKEERATAIAEGASRVAANRDGGRVEIPSIVVEGMEPDKVTRILEAVLIEGTAWGKVPGNYYKTVKPVKEQYELYLAQHSTGSGETEPLEAVVNSSIYPA